MDSTDIIFCDTETDGLWKAGYDEYHPDQPRPVQIAAARYTSTGEEIFAASVIIKPLESWPLLTEESIKIHGINEGLRRSGVSPVLAVTLLDFAGLNDNIALGGHNIGFDVLVLRRFLFELGFTDMAEMVGACPTVDTMHMSVELCKLPRKDGHDGYKRPSLTELHKELFNEAFSGAHDALADVRASARCYFELRKRGIEPREAVPPRTSGARSINLIKDVIERANRAPKQSDKEIKLVEEHTERLHRYGERYLASDKTWSWLVSIANRAE